MLFPFEHTPILGDGMTIGLMAVTHVVLSHGFAIGVFAYMVLMEHMALVRGDPGLEDLSRSMATPLVIVITAVGALTGVGIWFTLNTVAPSGIGHMLRVFFWPWFVEWAVFTLEVIVILFHYFLWDRMRERHWAGHVALGWSYVFVAFLSAFLISGILAFMLTSDGWTTDRNLFSAFFNPTFWPMLALRMFGAMALGGLFTLGYLLFTGHGSPRARQTARRTVGGCVLAFAAATAGCTWIYFGAVPATFATHSAFSVLSSAYSQHPEILTWGNTLAAAAVTAVALAALLRRRRMAQLLIVPALILAIALVAEFERVREFIRGPYLMPGYMYANQIVLTRSELMRDQGFLANTAWTPAPPPGLTPSAQAGHALFMANCGVCHTIGGVNDITVRVRGRTQPALSVLVGRANQMVPFMPPFSGTNEERLTLAAYLYTIAGSGRDINAVPPMQ